MKFICFVTFEIRLRVKSSKDFLKSCSMDDGQTTFDEKTFCSQYFIKKC